MCELNKETEDVAKPESEYVMGTTAEPPFVYEVTNQGTVVIKGKLQGSGRTEVVATMNNEFFFHGEDRCNARYLTMGANYHVGLCRLVEKLIEALEKNRTCECSGRNRCPQCHLIEDARCVLEELEGCE
jgi:hypothetical protein